MNWNTYYIYQNNDINSNISDKFILFKHFTVINDFVPTFTISHQSNFFIWFSYELKCIIKEKKLNHLASKKSNYTSDYF